MRSHKYKVSVERLEDKDGNPITDHSYDFTAENHDEIIEIVGRIQGTKQFSDDEAASLAVGLKLFGEVMLKNREHPLFTEFRPHFMDFMKKLKATVRNA